jgi:hypothetical protein
VHPLLLGITQGVWRIPQSLLSALFGQVHRRRFFGMTSRFGG